MNDPDPHIIWPNDALPRDTTINGYVVRRILGRGGFGLTYLAEDIIGGHFAIKEYFPAELSVRQDTAIYARPEDEAVFEECLERFVTESRQLVMLSKQETRSRAIVAASTMFRANRTAYLVMEYVDGQTLHERIGPGGSGRGGLAAQEIEALLRQLLTGLQVVHDAGILHRDIKPSNIMIRPDGSAVLIDFGASRVLTNAERTRFTQVMSGSYSPPEQIDGSRQGTYSDIYALGATLYRAIGGTLVESVRRKSAVDMGRPDPLSPAVAVGGGRYPGWLLRAIDAALAVQPQLRPASTREMMQILDAEAVLPAGHEADREAARDLQAAPTEIGRHVSALVAPADRTRAPRPKRRGFGLVLASLGVAAVLGGLGFVWSVRVAPSPPAPPPVVAIPTPPPQAEIPPPASAGPAAQPVPELPKEAPLVPNPDLACAKPPTEVEAAICASPDLIRLDLRLAALYRYARAHLPPDQARQMLLDQRGWNKGRAACIKRPDPTSCLAAEYSGRSTVILDAVRASPDAGRSLEPEGAGRTAPP